MNHVLSWEDFEKVDIRVGTVVDASVNEKARKPALKLTIDFGPLGIKTSSAQITALYQPETLVGKQVIAVVNFPPKSIAGFISQCLVLGCIDPNHVVTLLQPERPVANGLRVG